MARDVSATKLPRPMHDWSLHTPVMVKQQTPRGKARIIGFFASIPVAREWIAAKDDGKSMFTVHDGSTW